jgi:Spore coat protein CotO
LEKEKKSKPKLFLPTGLKQSLEQLQATFIYRIQNVESLDEKQEVNETKNVEREENNQKNEKNEKKSGFSKRPTHQPVLTSFKPRPAFKDLSILEKIDYMLNYPIQIKKPFCKIFLDKKIVTGKILSHENEYIKIETKKGTLKDIPISEIENITISPK